MTWIIVTLGSAFFFALNHICKKKFLEDSDVIDMMILTSSVSFIMILPFAKFVNFDISLRNLLLILTNTGFAVSGSFFINIAYKNCEISTVSPLLNFNPLLVIVFANFTLQETLSAMQFIGVLLILIGGYIITLKNIRYFFKPFTSMPKKYFLIVLLTLVLWSFCPILNRIVLVEVDAFTYLFFFITFICCVQIVLLILGNRFVNVRALAKRKWKLLIIICLFWIVSDFLHMVAIAIPTIMVSLVMPVKRTSNLFTVVIGGKHFNEKNLTVKFIACSIMLAGLLIIGIYS